VTAARQERHHDSLPDREIGYSVAHLLDNPGGLVPEQHGHRPHPISVNHREIRVTHPGRFDADQDLPGTGRLQVQFGDRYRL
jgi:hypothetical protein